MTTHLSTNLSPRSDVRLRKLVTELLPEMALVTFSWASHITVSNNNLIVGDIDSERAIVMTI